MRINGKNSFITSPKHMQSEQDFNEIIQWCDFPDLVSVQWIKLVDAWMAGAIHDNIFLHYVAWLDPDLFRATYCLINVYGGVSV